MNGVDLMLDLAARGVYLWREGDTLNYQTRKGILTNADYALLREHKAEILPLLPGANEAVYRNVRYAEWDGETHTIYCDGWVAPIVTRGLEPDLKRIAAYDAIAGEKRHRPP